MIKRKLRNVHSMGNVFHLRKSVPYYRKIQGITQEELAELLNVHRTYVSAIERGRRFPSGKILYHMAEILGVEVWKLFFDENDY